MVQYWRRTKMIRKTDNKPANILKIQPSLTSIVQDVLSCTDGKLEPLGRTYRGEAVYTSTHRRTNSNPITLHHLWLKPEEPCENTRCRKWQLCDLDLTAIMGIHWHKCQHFCHYLPPSARIDSTCLNSLRAASSCSTISCASTSGGGRFSVSSSESSLSQNMSKLVLSLAMSSSRP